MVARGCRHEPGRLTAARALADAQGGVERAPDLVRAGGLDDFELQVEIGDNVKVRILRAGISDVRAKGEPVKADAKS